MRHIVVLLVFCAAVTMAAFSQDFTTLGDFAGDNGYAPSGALMQAIDGNLYGLTAQGGAFNNGALYQVTPSGTLTLLHAFRNDYEEGYNPSGRLLQAPRTTTSGGELRRARAGRAVSSSPTESTCTPGTSSVAPAAPRMARIHTQG